MRSLVRTQMRATLMLIGLAVSGCGGPGEANEPGEPRLPAGDGEGAGFSVDPNRTVTEDEQAAAALPPGTLALQDADAGGKLQVQMAHCQVNNIKAWEVECGVDSSYVLVGGGAWVEYKGAAGALLTGSYPVNNGRLRSWRAGSKNHGVEQFHNLHVYAIGIKMSGITRTTLAGRVKIFEKTSLKLAWPTKSVRVADGYQLIGGGARVNWSGWGNLLVTSYPSDDRTWSASAKDHFYSSPASITTFAIGYKNQFLWGIPRLGIQIKAGLADAGTGVVSSSEGVDDGWVLTSIGADSDFEGAGRLLTKIAPTNPFTLREVEALTKDHLEEDGGTTTVYFIQARRNF